MPTTYAIPNGATVFAASTWTGADTGTGRSISGLQFAPDLWWGKSISASYYHQIFDSVRGAGSGKALASNDTGAEGVGNGATYGYLSSFDSSGVTYTRGSAGSGTNPDGYAYYDESGTTYVGWGWKAGGAAVSNTDGSITSQVSANTTAGFSVVTWTGNFTAGATIGHGLGVAPSMILVFRISTGGNDHSVYHSSVGATKSLFLNSTAGTNTDVGYWNNTAPTSSVITLGQSNYTNPSSGTMVAYCWAEVAGYSKAFTYTGNSSSDGAFVYLGFRPRYILHKNTASSQWMIWDTSRSPYNVLTNQELLANSANAQGTGAWGTEIDILSNGFKFRGYDNANFNYSGNTYIGFAFAENPFKYANAR